VPTRSLKTPFSKRLVQLEASSASADEIREVIGYRRSRAAQLEGNLTDGELYCGASAGLINDIVPASHVVERLVEGYKEIVGKLKDEHPTSNIEHRTLNIEGGAKVKRYGKTSKQ
jgi:enoyl-[acyl-carrier protein] reductase II